MSIPEVWFGTAASYDQVLKAHQWGLENPHYRPEGFGVRTAAQDSDDDDDQTLVEFLAENQIEVHDNVGVLKIDGPLVNEDLFWNAIFGLVSYNTLTTALNMLLEDPEVTDIIADVSTPGGDSQGLEGFSNNLRKAATIKPITSWSGTNALSAGYWIASATTKVTGSTMAEFGSIGVITTAPNYAKMLEKEGIGVDIIRAGEYKAPVHPAEPLSDKGREVLTQKTERLYGFFLSHVVDNRPVDINDKDRWAEGRVFFAQEAMGVGLVDEVITLNELVDRLIDTQDPEPTGDTQMPATKVILSDPSSKPKLEGDKPKVELTEAEIAAKLDVESQSAVEPQSQLTEEPASDPDQDAPEQPSADLVAYLQGQIDTVRAELAEATAENLRLKTRCTEMEEQNTAFNEIAVHAIHDYQIRLGQAPVNLSDIPSSTVISYYTACRKEFHATFPTGRVSLDAEEAPKTTPESAARALGITPSER